MNYFKEFIEDLLTEVSYRTKEGVVDFNNPTHIGIFSEVLDERGLSEIKHELIQNLFEADEEKESDKKEGMCSKKKSTSVEPMGFSFKSGKKRCN